MLGYVLKGKFLGILGLGRIGTEVAAIAKAFCNQAGFEVANEALQVMGGMGISILSTPRGLMTGSAARKEGVGGELLGEVWR